MACIKISRKMGISTTEDVQQVAETLTNPWSAKVSESILKQ